MSRAPRLAPPLALIAAALVLAPASAVAAPVAVAAEASPATPAAPMPGATVQARLSACRTGPAGDDRSAAFQGAMRAVPGTRRMAIRFDLRQRLGAGPDGVFAPVAVPGLGVWQRSQPGRPAFVFTQRVQQLAAPAAYRAVVRFRWYGPGGRLLRAARRVTGVCRQPELRPSLAASLLDVVAAPGGVDATYRFIVRNRGRSVAGAFDVALALGDAPAGATRLARVPRLASLAVAFTAARCTPGTTLRLVVDAAGEVDEADEGDNVLALECPLGG